MDFVTRLRQKIRSDIFSSSDVKSLLSPITDATIHRPILGRKHDNNNMEA